MSHEGMVWGLGESWWPKYPTHKSWLMSHKSWPMSYKSRGGGACVRGALMVGGGQGPRVTNLYRACHTRSKNPSHRSFNTHALTHSRTHALVYCSLNTHALTHLTYCSPMHSRTSRIAHPCTHAPHVLLTHALMYLTYCSPMHSRTSRIILLIAGMVWLWKASSASSSST